MLKKVLIVDDDQEMLSVLRKGLEKYSKIFFLLTAEDGLIALELLKRNNISVVVTELNLPRIDGLTLLTHLKEHYPDIQAIVTTAYSTPAKEECAFNQGVAGYIKKPFITEDLAKNILAVIKKESEGGVLHGIAPGTFLQLLEMEQKTCTIRLVDDKSGNQGSLFFREGELLDARINELHGREAAYKILSWEEATLSIQESCPVNENKVQADLQAVLLEAMRLKDEIRTEEKMTQEEIDDYITAEREKGAVREIIVEAEEDKIGGAGEEVETNIVLEAKEPAYTISGKSKDGWAGEAGSGAGPNAISSEGTTIPYTMVDNIFGAIANMKSMILGSAVFRYTFRALALSAAVCLMGLIYLFITLETEKDLMKRIEQTKSNIRSSEEALSQLDEEIQNQYVVKEDSIKNNESQVVIMELDLKISELEEKQEKILMEIKILQKTLEEHQTRLNTMKEESLLDRLMENANKHLP